jgi:hypothetical protein
VARRGQPNTKARRTTPRNQRRGRDRDDLISPLARAVGAIETALRRGRVTPATRTKFQAAALVLRAEHARAKETGNPTRRAEQLKRLDGIATTLAKAAVRDAALLALLDENAEVSYEAGTLTRDMMRAAGIEPEPELLPPTEPPAAEPRNRVVPQSVVSRQLANPFLAPDFSAARPRTPVRRGWPIGNCSARSSARSNAQAVERRRAWRCPLPRRGTPGPVGS